MDVTLGVVQAQEALFRLAPGFAAAGAVHGRSLLIGAAPGETHGFGVSMVAEFFRHGGWVVAAEPLDDATDWERAVAGTWYDVVGVSIGTEDLLPRLRGLVQGIRARACNPMLAVMVGGPLLLQRPGIARDCGADATATDAADALRKAEALLRLPAKAA